MTLVFEPDYTPVEMMRLGIFGGNYFANAKKKDFDQLAPAILRYAEKECGPFDPDNNQYGVAAGHDLQAWIEKGWIFDEDPLGWFHWYCRYASGRRLPEMDEIQIKRWINFKSRSLGMARYHLQRKTMTPAMRQNLLQWGLKVPKVGKT